MKDKRITVVHKHPGKEPKLVVVDNELHALQTLVDGYIEIGAYISKGLGDALVIVCDEEGKLKGKVPNVLVDHFTWMDNLVGPVFGAKISEEDFVDLTDEEAEYLMYWLSKYEVARA